LTNISPPTRPWDVSDRGGQTVVERQREELDEAMLHLLANDPQRAVYDLQFAAYLLKKVIKRQEETRARAECAERIARKHKREREKIEREERRLARERERARKRLRIGIRGVAS
jgi:hypothetical protein